jgi:choline dehydrogenase-like flavoprotein
MSGFANRRNSRLKSRLMTRKRMDPVDVVIIGAGCGGAAFAWQIKRQAPHLKIVCLERGGWADPTRMPAKSMRWQRAILEDWASNPNLRLKSGAYRGSNDYAIDDGNSVFKPLMWNGVGGSTVAWAAHFPRLHPSDFRTRTLDAVADDWPFDYFELEPWYDRNDEVMGVAGLNGDPAYPPKSPRAMPPLPFGAVANRAARAFSDLGWHWWPVDAAINSVPHDGRAACNNCGPCLIGCIPKAKSSVDLTYWPKAMALGVELRTVAIARHVHIEAGCASGVTYADRHGAEYFQPAEAVVVAGNGIGTARLLLGSGIDSPALGRNLMYHPAAYVRGLFKDRLDGPVGPVGCSIYSHEFYETDRARGFERGVHLQLSRENALAVQASRLQPLWGETAQAQLREEFLHSMPILVLAEDLPETHNRVTLTRAEEPDGLSGVKVDYAVAERAQRSLDFGLARAEEVLFAAGAYRTIRVSPAPLTGWHLLGTARMGHDPQTSVVDRKGRCHRVPNVIVADGSVFPTVGAANPASTIGAVALKFAAELAEDMS